MTREVGWHLNQQENHFFFFFFSAELEEAQWASWVSSSSCNTASDDMRNSKSVVCMLSSSVQVSLRLHRNASRSLPLLSQSLSLSPSLCQCVVSLLPSFCLCWIPEHTGCASQCSQFHSSSSSSWTDDSAVTMSAGVVVCTGWLVKSPPEKKLKRFVSISRHHTLVLWTLCQEG